MIKKTTAIIFLLISNFILLFYYVVPHHHHQKQICFKLSHYALFGNEAYKDNYGKTHLPDADHDHENCVIKEVVILPSQEFRYKIINKNDGYFNNGDSQPGNLSLNNINNSSYSFPGDFIFLAENPHKYSLILTVTYGLRAPPVV